MNNNILIFRTDRIGDLLVSCPAIITIKKYIKNSNITLITSKKNYEYAKSLRLFNEIYIFPDNGLFSKIFFIFKLIKKKFNYIFIFDGKDRSIITSCFLKSRYKVALTQKINFLYKIFNIKFYIDSEKTDLNNIFQNFLSYCEIEATISNYDFLRDKTNNNFSREINIENYFHIHLDEKWFSNLYIKKYKTIAPEYNEFIGFLDILSNEKDILITTGLIDFNLINELKDKYFKKKDEKIFIKHGKNKSIYLIYKPSFDDLESLLRRSNTLIACHGAITHAANSFDIKKIDIFEKKRKDFYKKYTSCMNNYYPIYRKNFNDLKNEIFKNII